MMIEKMNEEEADRITAVGKQLVGYCAQSQLSPEDALLALGWAAGALIGSVLLPSEELINQFHRVVMEVANKAQTDKTEIHLPPDVEKSTVQ
jgi:hypothetical protein